MSKEQRGEARKEKNGPSALEWFSAAVGAIIAIAILGFIGLEALRSRPDRPPIIDVRPTAVVAGDGTYVVELTVANRSGQTAAALGIAGELRQGDKVVETSNATLSYVPGHSEREAGLIFSRDPRAYDLEVRATGYETP